MGNNGSILKALADSAAKVGLDDIEYCSLAHIKICRGIIVLNEQDQIIKLDDKYDDIYADDSNSIEQANITEEL